MNREKNLNEINNKERVELHLHTTFSAMNALTRVNEAIKKAAELGHPAIAITDYGNVQAFPQAEKAAKKYGIKVIYGLECDCYNDCNENNNDIFRVILLVKNAVGRKTLYRLISSYYADKKISIPKSVLQKHREGLLIGAVGYKGELSKGIVSGKNIDELSVITSFYDYIEILPSFGTILIENQKLDRKKQQELNKDLAFLANSENKPLVAAGNVHFLEPEDEICKKVLLSAKGLDTDDSLPLYFRTTEEMLDEFSYLGEEAAIDAVINNSQKIANLVEDNLHPYLLGSYYPTIKDAEKELIRKCKARVEKIYGTSLPNIVKERLEWELDSISSHDFATIFTIAERLVERSKTNGYTVGSRCNIAASLVAFLLGITNINPLPPHYICSKCKYTNFQIDKKYCCGFDLPDEICPLCGEKLNKDGFDISATALLGFDGDMVPDIDLIFSDEYQETAASHLEEIFGKGYVVPAGDTLKLSERLAFAYAERFNEDNNANLDADGLINISEKLVGVKRDDWRHPGGFFALPSSVNILDFSPIHKFGEKMVTHFTASELSGYLLKIDILGHDVPTLIKNLQNSTGISPDSIPLDDADTLQRIASCDAIGIPEFQSFFMRDMLRKATPTCFSDLIKLSGLSHGTGTWKENAEHLITNKTVGLKDVIALRDDVMTFLIKKGMPPKEAYKYMRLIKLGRLSSDSYKENWQSVFKEYGIDDWYIESAKKIKYLFPKAHSAVYTIQSFQLAWYKTHYPTHFYTVTLNFLDEDNVFTASDFEKSVYDLQKELERLLAQADNEYYWSDNYHNKRIRAIELLLDTYLHGQAGLIDS